MSRFNMKHIRELGEDDLTQRIQDTRSELAKLRISQSKGTLRKENGKIRPMRRDIARMLTRKQELKKK